MKKRKSPDEFYVYALIDPRDGETFYIGKGCGDRVNYHEKNNERSKNLRKAAKIRSIIDSGLSVAKKFIATGLPEREALDREREEIMRIGLERLTNISPGALPPQEKAQLLAESAIRLCKSYPLFEPFVEMVAWAKRDWDGFRNSFYTRICFGPDGRVTRMGFAAPDRSKPMPQGEIDAAINEAAAQGWRL